MCFCRCIVRGENPSHIKGAYEACLVYWVDIAYDGATQT